MNYARRRKKAASTHPGESGSKGGGDGRPAGFLQGLGIGDFRMARGG